MEESVKNKTIQKLMDGEAKLAYTYIYLFNNHNQK